MEKQKSYGKNFQNIKPKHTFSKKFLTITLAFCVLAVILCVTIGNLL